MEAFRSLVQVAKSRDALYLRDEDDADDGEVRAAELALAVAKLKARHRRELNELYAAHEVGEPQPQTQTQSPPPPAPPRPIAAAAATPEDCWVCAKLTAAGIAAEHDPMHLSYVPGPRDL